MRRQSSLTTPFSRVSSTRKSISPCRFISTATSAEKNLILNETQINVSAKTHGFLKKPVETPFFTQIINRGKLNDAFLWSGDSCHRLFLYPDAAFASALDLCASKKALSQGRQLHAHIIKVSCLNELVLLDNKLLFMYGKCGCVTDAEKMFDKMRKRTAFALNAMIGAYVSNAEPFAALKIYREMRVSGVSIDVCSFPGLLKACGLVNDISFGSELHGLVVKLGYDLTVFVVNALVAMYAKCGDLNAARQLFDGMMEKGDVVLWNSIVSSYSAYGKSVEGLEIFRKMQKASIATNGYTFVAALQTCEDSSYVKLGMEIHAAVLKSSHCFDVYVYNALIAMYTNCGKMAEAAIIFGEMDKKDRVSWNSMITGFVQNCMYNEGIAFFRDMLDAGQMPDEFSITSIITASGRLGNLLNGMEIHAYIAKCGLDSHLQVGNTLIDMYAKCCYINYMGCTFSMMPDKDLVSWTTIIAGYAQTGCNIDALKLFRDIQMKGMEVDAMMLGSVLLACSGLKCMPWLKEIHSYILRRGLSDLVIQNAIVDVYGACGNIDYATRMFESNEHKDVVSWTSIISSSVHNGLANEALDHFYRMKETGIEPDSVTLISLLSAVASLSALRKAKEIHSYLLRKGFSSEGSTASSLIDMYFRCGDLVSAHAVFTSTQSKDLVQWTSMINAYGMHGNGKAAIDLFTRMKHENITPDHITFLVLLYACSHAGMIDEGRRCLEIMEREYRLEPWPEHYACLVDLLGRANGVEEAYEFVKSMKTVPTAEVWCALLAACRAYSNEDIGEIAAQRLLELDPGNPGNFVLVSNVFAASGRWKDVEAVRIKMSGSGLKKSPGCSWIEIGNKVHGFIARDMSHPETKDIYQG